MRDNIFQKAETDSGAQYLKISEWDRRYPVRTFFSTKNGGVSEGSFSSLNMGFSTGDDRACVEENRRRIFDFVGEAGYCEAVPHQVHRDEIACIRAENLECLAELPIQNGTFIERTEAADTWKKRGLKLSFPETDAAITNVPNVILTSLHADCLPVWLYDPKNHAAGLVHAGWRGTRADIAAKTAHKMCAAFGSAMEDIIAVIGPGISERCFEVGAEVAEEFAAMLGEKLLYNTSDRHGIGDGNGKYHLDLKEINRELLFRAGIQRIEVSEYCTYCSEDLFYSYRRDGGITGRMCAGIVLLPAR